MADGVGKQGGKYLMTDTAGEILEGAPGRYWSRLEDGRIRCELCPRYCAIRPGQRGLCFVRGNRDGEMVLTTYGRSSGFCVDPIEKKPLNHFYPGTPILSFGTAGCNLTCKFCQNWDMSKSRQMDTLADAAGPELLARAALELGCKSVAFTYNDPIIFLEYAVDVARACHAVGVKTVAVTAGYICAEPRAEFFAHMDAANVDLKAFSEDFYRRLCSGALAPILETLAYLKRETEVWFEITTLLIPGANDSPAEIDAMSAWLAEHLGPDVPLQFSAFHPDYRMTELPRTPHESLLRARQIALANGLHHVFVGNVHDQRAASSYCHACGELLIGRDWYQLGAWRLDDQGNCLNCGTACAGRFDGPAGSWGRQRRPVRLGAGRQGARR